MPTVRNSAWTSRRPAGPPGKRPERSNRTAPIPTPLLPSSTRCAWLFSTVLDFVTPHKKRMRDTAPFAPKNLFDRAQQALRLGSASVISCAQSQSQQLCRVVRQLHPDTSRNGRRNERDGRNRQWLPRHPTPMAIFFLMVRLREGQDTTC